MFTCAQSLGEVMKAGQSEGRAEPTALRGRVDAYDVDLAEAAGMNFRPVEAEELASVFVDGHEQPCGVEPSLAAPLGDVGGRPAALFGVPGERGVVDAQ